jgi:hypothetical protein
MTWELDEIDQKTEELRNPTNIPDTMQSGLLFKPFFYVIKPECLHGTLL